MAYGTKYKISFNNELQERYDIYIAFDGYVGSETTLRGSGEPLELQWIHNDENILQGIIPLQAIIRFVIPVGSTLSFEDFITQRDDEIYISIQKDSVYWIFHGWLVAEQGAQQFKDPPFVIELKCVDGLGLTKNTPLTNSAGVNFTGRNSLAAYLGGILAKANNQLAFKVWCDIYELSMTDRDTDDDKDMFSQTYVDSRTFLDSEVTFVDCYEALEKIISNHFIVFYYLGSWNIVRVADLQRSGPVHFVQYNLDGTVIPSIIFSPQGDTATAKIGRAERIFTHGGDAIKSIEFAKKQVRLTYNYRQPENLVNNQKITQLGSFIAPVTGYNLVGWSQKHNFLHLRANRNVQQAYIKVETDVYGYEQQRYYVIPVDRTAIDIGNFFNYIINDNDDFFVDKDDKIGISFQYRYSFDLTDPSSTLVIGQIGIHRDGTTGTNNADWITADQNGFWLAGAGRFMGVNLVGQDATEWRTISFTDSVIPQSGRLYISFGPGNVPTSVEIHIKDLQITYSPQVRGGYTAVRGDFNRYEQNAKYKTSIAEDVNISDAPKRMIGGALFKSNGTELLPPTWYRRGVSESKRYTQLVAQGEYNLTYRKFRTIEGQFKGYSYEKDSGGAIIPFGPMTKFEFVDTGEARQYLVMNPKLKIKQGWFDGTFREIYDPGTNDGNEDGDTYEFNYLF